MGIRIATLSLALCMPRFAAAQQDESLPTPEAQERPEEVVVIGYRTMLELRTQMVEAEIKAYDIFNQFNDEKRFDISCSMQQPTGSHIDSATPLCQPGFEIEALRAHGRDQWESLRSLLDPYNLDYSPQIAAQPAAAMIAAQQEDYRRKMKQVAEEHPEFLEAIIQYSEKRRQYEEASRAVRE